MRAACTASTPRCPYGRPHTTLECRLSLHLACLPIGSFVERLKVPEGFLSRRWVRLFVSRREVAMSPPENETALH